MDLNYSRTALVTGASRGIGKAIAAALAGDGWNLILTCSRTLPELSAFAADLEERHHVLVRSVLCDMGDSASVSRLFAGIPSLELLVNNAGIAHIGLLQDMTDEEWDRILATNLSSVFYTSRAAIPLFLKNRSRAEDCDTGAALWNTKEAAFDAVLQDTRKFNSSGDDVRASSKPKEDGIPAGSVCPGRILNISSVWGNVGASCEAAYSATKGGVNSLTRALAKELAPSGIPVNAIACGCVDTAMNGQLSAEEKAELSEEIPAGRFAEPGEIAAAALQLIHAPAYLTGQIVTVDGGWI